MSLCRVGAGPRTLGALRVALRVPDTDCNDYQPRVAHPVCVYTHVAGGRKQEGHLGLCKAGHGRLEQQHGVRAEPALAKEAQEWFDNVATVDDDFAVAASVTPKAIEDARD